MRSVFSLIMRWHPTKGLVARRLPHRSALAVISLGVFRNRVIVWEKTGQLRPRTASTAGCGIERALSRYGECGERSVRQEWWKTVEKWDYHPNVNANHDERVFCANQIWVERILFFLQLCNYRAFEMLNERNVLVNEPNFSRKKGSMLGGGVGQGLLTGAIRVEWKTFWRYGHVLNHNLQYPIVDDETATRLFTPWTSM